MPGKNIIGRCVHTSDSDVFNRLTIAASMVVSESLEAVFTPDDPEFATVTILRESSVEGSGSKTYQQMPFDEEWTDGFFHLTRGCCCKCRWAIFPEQFEDFLTATRNISVTTDGETEIFEEDVTIGGPFGISGIIRQCRSAAETPSAEPPRIGFSVFIPITTSSFPGAPDFEWPVDIEGGVAGPDNNAGIPLGVATDPIDPCAPGEYTVVLSSSVSVSDSYYNEDDEQTVDRTYIASFTATYTITIAKD